MTEMVPSSANFYFGKTPSTFPTQAWGELGSRSLSGIVLERPSAQAWGVLTDGTNQGVRHFVDYWEKFPERLPSLEQRLGLPSGSFSQTHGGFDLFTEQAGRVTTGGISRTLADGRTAFYLDGAVNANRGVVMIQRNGLYQTMMPSDPRSFLKLK